MQHCETPAYVAQPTPAIPKPQALNPKPGFLDIPSAPQASPDFVGNVLLFAGLRAFYFEALLFTTSSFSILGLGLRVPKS